MSYVPGRIGTAFRIDGGSGAGVSLGSVTSLQRSQFSLEGWIRRGSLSATSLSGPEGTLLGADTGGWYVSLLQNGALALGRSGVSSVQSSAAVTDLNWHHVAVTRSSTQVQFFVDGNLVSAPDYLETFALDLPYGLGGLFPTGRNAFLGDIDELSFYQRVLTAAEVKVLGTSGSAPKCYQDLTINSTAGGPVSAGENFTARFLVTSVGNDSTGVTLNYSLPAGMQFISASASQGTVENLAGLIRAQLGTIPTGSNAVVTVVFRPLVPGIFNLLATVARNEAELTLENNRFESTLDVRKLTVNLVEDIAVSEQSGGLVPAEFEIALNAVSPRTVSVDYETIGGTATPDQDYTSVRGRIEFPPGVVSQRVPVSVLGDGIYETTETFRLVIRNPVNAELGRSSATAVIQSPDPMPLVSVRPIVAPEGQAGPSLFRFDVTLDRASGAQASVTYATLNDSARAPTDFTAVGGSLLFAPGETHKVIEVAVNGDTAIEPNELFYLVLSQPEGLRLASGTDPKPSGTILNDDVVPGQVSGFHWDSLPTTAMVSEPFTAQLTAQDATGAPVPDFGAVVELKAFPGPGLPSPVVFTEVVTTAPGAVELQNVGTNAVDVSGWSVHFYDLDRWPAPKATFVFPSGTLMEANDVVVIDATVLAGGSYPRFRLGQAVAWSDRGTAGSPKAIRIGAVLADNAGTAVDSFFADDAVPSEIAIPSRITAEDWAGPAVPPALSPNTGFLRTPSLGHNSRQASDWSFSRAGALNLGLRNAGLVVPFIDAVPVLLEPVVANGFLNGSWSGSLTLAGFAPEVRLVADDGNGHRGVSPSIPMKVTDDLNIELTTDQPVVTAGDLWVQYEALVRNLGTRASSNVTAVLLLPSIYGAFTDDGPNTVSQGSMTQSLVPGPSGQTLTKVTASFGELAGGAQAKLTYFARGRISFTTQAYPSNVVTTASLTSLPTELNLSNNSASITQEVSSSCVPIASGVAWWQADGTTSSLFNSLPSVEEGAMQYGEGRVGTGSFHFNGTNALRVAHQDVLNFGPNRRIRPGSLVSRPANDPSVHDLVEQGAVERQLHHRLPPAIEQWTCRARARPGPGAVVSRRISSADLRDGAWHHLYFGRDFSATLDGRQVTSGDNVTPGDLSTDAPLLIGRSPRADLDDHWVGDLDEIVIHQNLPGTLAGVAAARAGAHGHCISELFYQPVQPRFTSTGPRSGPQWMTVLRASCTGSRRISRIRDRDRLWSG